MPFTILTTLFLSTKNITNRFSPPIFLSTVIHISFILIFIQPVSFSLTTGFGAFAFGSGAGIIIIEAVVLEEADFFPGVE